jgi:hypothetical protein
MTYYEIGEVEQIITPDGNVFALNNGLDRAVTEIGGRGMSGIEYDTEQGYLQPHPVMTAWRLEARSARLFLSFVNQSRADYWQYREELIDYLRPNRGGPLILRHIRQDGTQRDLYCHADSSPVIDNDFDWDTVQVEIDLIAFDPLFKDPIEQVESYSFSPPATEDLVFPVTLYMKFEQQTTHDTFDISYSGTFVSYPRIEIDGPYTSVLLTNLQTGAQVGLTVPILEGDKRIIDLTPNAQSIVDENGDEHFNELLLPESNLINFNLRQSGQAWENSPYEGVPNGLNQIQYQIGGLGEGTAIALYYYRQYIGL